MDAVSPSNHNQLNTQITIDEKGPNTNTSRASKKSPPFVTHANSRKSPNRSPPNPLSDSTTPKIKRKYRESELEVLCELRERLNDIMKEEMMPVKKKKKDATAARETIKAKLHQNQIEKNQGKAIL